MPSLSFPFRVHAATGAVATNPDGSDAEVNEAIALHILTETGERPLRPTFGTPSLPFGLGLDQSALQLQLAENGWDHVMVTGLESGPPSDGRQNTVVTWERNA